MNYEISLILVNFDETRKICPVEDFQYLPSKSNPADLATRTGGKLEEIGIDSDWQSPKFLKEPRENWPFSSKNSETDHEQKQKFS